MVDGTDTSVAEIIKTQSPGLRLKKAREAQGLTLEAVTKEIPIKMEVLRDIENDVHILGKAPVYAKGYVRLYANFLSVAASEILPLLEELQPPHVAKSYRVPIEGGGRRDSAPAKKNKRVAWRAMALFGLFFMVLWLWVKQHPIPASTSTTITQALPTTPHSINMPPQQPLVEVPDTLMG